MTITKQQTDDALVIALAGRLDTTTSPELEKRAEGIPSRGEPADAGSGRAGVYLLCWSAGASRGPEDHVRSGDDVAHPRERNHYGDLRDHRILGHSDDRVI